MQLIIKILTLFLLPINLLAVNHWNPKANFGGEARHRATAFSISDKGYIGMGHINSAEHILYKDIWEYDPATNSWTQKADFGGGLRYQCAAFSIGDVAYMGTGRNEFDTYESDFWKYNPLSNTWYPIADFPGEERRGASGFSIDGKGYVGLGQATSGYASDFYEYDPATDHWVQMADFIGLPRTSAVSFTHNGKAYVGTGHTYSLALKDFYEFTPSSNHWIQKSDVGDTLRQDATGFMINGKGYLGTGNNVDGSINYKDFWEYDFDLDTWTQIEDFRGASRRYMVSFVINNTAYCGTGTNGTNLRDFWSYDPTLDYSNSNAISSIKSFPNPASTKITFTFPPDIIASNSYLTIFNSVGQKIDEIVIDQTEIILEKKNLNNGVYFFHVSDNINIKTSGKFIFIE